MMKQRERVALPEKKTIYQKKRVADIEISSRIL